MIQFQFPNSVEKSNWNEKLKLKMRNFQKKPKHVFIAGKEIRQYEIVYNQKTGNFERLRLPKRHDSTASWKRYGRNMLFDDQRNELIFSSTNSNFIQVWDLDRNEDQMTSIIRPHSVMTWYFFNKKKYLVNVPNSENKIEFWDWETKQLFKTLETNAQTSSDLLINEDELITCDYNNTISIWCLKTFTCLKTFSIQTVPRCLCKLGINKNLFAYTDQDRKIEIRNKHTGEIIHKKEETNILSSSELICSEHLNLILSFGDVHYLKFWTLDLKLVFLIPSPFKQKCTQMKFLNPENQTQVIIGDIGGNLFIVDLLSRTVIWETKTFNGSVESILVQ